MGYGKWIGGLMGFVTMGPLGALAGFAIGSLFDNANENMIEGSDVQNEYAGQRNSFLFSMLVMASYIIRADGRIMHSEMEYVRNFLRNNFGEAAVSEGEQILLNLFEQRKQMDRTNPMAFKNTINQCGQQIAENMTYEERLQLLSFLAQIAKSDGNVCKEEIDALREVALSMGLSYQEVESMLNMRGKSLDEAYKVLEVSPDASDEEVRAAYKKMALKHHPDRVATLGEDIRKAAEEKFQDIKKPADTFDRIFQTGKVSFLFQHLCQDLALPGCEDRVYSSVLLKGIQIFCDPSFPLRGKRKVHPVSQEIALLVVTI